VAMSPTARLAGCALGLLLVVACAPQPAQPAPPPASTISRGPTSTPEPTPTPTATTPRGLPAALRGTEWEHLPTGRRVVALTFDAGANADGVDAILAVLAAQHVPATFFLTGRWVQRFPAQARRIGSTYPVGNHSQTHPKLTVLSDGGVRAEVDTAGAAITAATGRDPHPLFRFPFGDRNPHTIALVNAAGYGSIRWTVDTTGWRGTSGGVSVDRVRARVLAGLGPGEIVLMHVGSNPDDGSRLDADALPGLIADIRARGYDFVSVTDFL
jgi:peptidoglycan/xylan/chitin deacetylase (PgdA/CDA1 family)